MSDDPKRTKTIFDEQGAPTEVEVSRDVTIEPDPPGVHSPENVEPMLPRCPFCGADPCFPMVIPFQSGDVRARAMFCPNKACRAMFSCQIIQVRG